MQINSLKDISIHKDFILRVISVEDEYKKLTYCLGSLVIGHGRINDILRYNSQKVFIPAPSFENKAELVVKKYEDTNKQYYILRLANEEKIYQSWGNVNKRIINHFKDYVNNLKNENI